MKDKFGYQTGKDYFTSSSHGIQVADLQRQFAVYKEADTQNYFNEALIDQMKAQIDIFKVKQEFYEEYDIRSVTQKIKNKENTEWATLMVAQKNQLNAPF
jgi:hypothetical protein